MFVGSGGIGVFVGKIGIGVNVGCNGGVVGDGKINGVADGKGVKEGAVVLVGMITNGVFETKRVTTTGGGRNCPGVGRSVPLTAVIVPIAADVGSTVLLARRVWSIGVIVAGVRSLLRCVGAVAHKPKPTQ